MNFSAQTNAVCGNGQRLRKWGVAGSLEGINDDSEQTPCLRLKAAWNKAWRYIYTKKDSLLLYINSLSFPSRKTPYQDPRLLSVAMVLPVRPISVQVSQ
jgi:hypothetical protein